MQYMWQYEVASICISLVMVAICLIRRPFMTRGWRCFLVAIGMNLVSSSIDLLTILPIDLPVWAKWTANIVYLGTFFSTVMVAYWYVLGVTRKWKQTALEKAYWVVCFLAGAVLLLSSPANGGIFRITEDGVYQHGPLFPVLYVLCIGMMIVNLAACIRCWKTVPMQARIALVIYEISTVISLAFEVLHPASVIDGFTISVLLVLVYALLENPETYLYHGTSCFNERALICELQKRMHAGARFTLLTIRFEASGYMGKVFSALTSSMFVNAASEALLKILPRDQIYATARHQFVLLIPESIPEELIIGKIQERFSQRLTVDNLPAVVTPCIGKISHPGLISTPEEMEQLIHILFDKLRAEPSDRLLVATAEMLKQSHRQELIVTAIRNAIRTDSLSICYQPIYDTHDGRFHTAEANVRINDESLGNISTEEIIIAAEKTGLILSLGEKIARKIYRFWTKERLEQYGVRYVEVNISGVQCVQPDLVESVVTHARQEGMPMSRINFEITETSAMTNDESLARSMRRLAEYGVTFSMDDYGTGYSNIMRLTNLPFSLVKIDKAILWSAVKDYNALAVLRNTISLLHDLHKLVVVEGVETDEMKKMLDEIGCDYYQGYYFSKPLSEENYLRFLREHQEE